MTIPEKVITKTPVTKKDESCFDEIREVDGSSSSSSDNMFGSLIKKDGWSNLAKSVVAKEKSRDKSESPLLQSKMAKTLMAGISQLYQAELKKTGLKFRNSRTGNNSEITSPAMSVDAKRKQLE